MGRYKTNIIIIHKDYAIIKIQNKLKGELDCLIDVEDIHKVKNYYWNIRYDKRHPNCTVYVETQKKNNEGKYKRMHLHRFIMNCPEDKIIDHINGNGLDNRKNNLRICTQSYNGKNRPFAKNIYFVKRDNLYNVHFNINGKTKYLCYTRDIKEAQEYALLGRKLINENKIDELMNMKCKCILHSYN